MIKIERIVHWMNTIRNHEGTEQYRILESFWESQLTSKQWIIDTLDKNKISVYGSVYIFGGWFGVLGGMLLDVYKNIHHVYSVDLDPEVKRIGEQLNPDVTFITSDMKTFSFSERPSLVINTSTEHVSQNTFDVWLKQIPNFVPIVLQGNNFFSCPEHIRCSNSLKQFQEMNFLNTIKYADELDCKQFIRYMTIGYKL